LLERLDEDGRVAPIPAGRPEHLEEPVLQRQTDRLVIGRMLRLRIDADRASRFLGLLLRQGDDLLEGRDVESTVELLRALGEWLDARKVLISARVKSETNQPSSVAPSMIAVRRRLANSGRVETSVVAMMFGSWRATRWPSLVATRSGSM
jgi:hypothetical protein